MKLRIEFRSKPLEEREAWLSQKFHDIERSDILLCIAVTIYAIAFSCITILRYYSFMTHAWDMGIFTQGGVFKKGTWVVGLKKAVERKYLMSCLTRPLLLGVSRKIPGRGILKRLGLKLSF